MTDTTELRMHGKDAMHIICNCHPLLRRQFAKSPLWSMVSSITGHGSGYSIEVCKSADLDPHQLCGAKLLKRGPK